MQRLTLAHCTPEPADQPTRYQVGFDVVLDDGSERHYPVTVYARGLPDTLPSTILARAEALVLPGIAAEDAAVAPPADEEA